MERSGEILMTERIIEESDDHKSFITSEDKINQALGISDDSTIDDVLAGFDNDIKSIESEMKTAVSKIDNELVKCNDVHTLTNSLGELSELIGTSKGMLKDVYDYISRSEIMDPDVIGAGADLIKASNELIHEYLEIYKEKIRHFNSIELEMIKAKNKRDLEQFKFDLKNNKIDDAPIDMVEYTQESLIKAINDMEKGKRKKS